MKKILVFFMVVFSLAATNSLFAQNQGQMQQMMKAYLKDSVKLSDVLVDSAMAIRMQFMPQIRGVFMDQSLSAADKQAKMQELRDRMQSRYIAAGLTQDQVMMIEDHDARMRQQMRNRMNGGQNQ